MTEQDLLDLKQEITDAKAKTTKLEGRHDLLLEQLKDKYGVTTIGQAKKKLKAMEKSLETLDEEIKENTEKLEQRINEQTSDTQDQD